MIFTIGGADLKLTLQQFVNNSSHEYVSIIERHRQLRIEHTHDYFELFLVNSGFACHFVNGANQMIKKGTLVFIRPEDSHYYSSMSPDFRIMNMLLSKEIVSTLFDFLGEGYNPDFFYSSPLPQKVQLSQPEYEYVVNELEKLVLSKRVFKSTCETYFRIALFNIFTMGFPLAPVSQHTNIPDWLRWLVLEMMKKENFITGLDAMKRLSNRSYEHMARACRKYLHKTPTELINELRIDYAAKEIISSGESITNICYNSGFQNLSHFYHVFKSQYGCPPVEFKNRVERKEISNFDTNIFLANTKSFSEGIDFHKISHEPAST